MGRSQRGLQGSHPEGQELACDVGATYKSGTVTFAVDVDNVKKYESGVLSRKSLAERIHVDVRNAEALKLVVGDAGDHSGNDHAVWANAMLA